MEQMYRYNVVHSCTARCTLGGVGAPKNSHSEFPSAVFSMIQEARCMRACPELARDGAMHVRLRTARISPPCTAFPATKWRRGPNDTTPCVRQGLVSLIIGPRAYRSLANVLRDRIEAPVYTMCCSSELLEFSIRSSYSNIAPAGGAEPVVTGVIRCPLGGNVCPSIAEAFFGATCGRHLLFA
jgi:hypothetical protein